jgi:beta-lactamase regulating signal transducer with metallopeptidase domain
MTDLFLTILNMSVTASYVAVAVILVRFLLRSAPKLFSYLLWLAVAIRLVIPVSFTSNFSIFRLVQPKASTDTGYVAFIPQEIRMLKHPAVTIESFAASIAGASPVQIIVWVGSIVWIMGAAVLLLYSVASYLNIRAKVRTATLVRGNIFETDRISTPFVCGFLKPKIYIPTGLSEQELSYILLHEQTHITRRDYWIKPFAFILLIIHWFNPLMWLSYALMCKDMEMSCDERVVDKMGSRIKASYSTSLLSFSVSRSGVRTGSPLAFGESHVKARIKNILSYRQPSSWIVAGYMLVFAVFVLGCIANPTPLQPTLHQPPQPPYSGYRLDKLMENKTLYVGNAGKVGGLISGMPKPNGIKWNGLELETKSPPYGVIIHYSMNDATDVLRNGAISHDVFYRNSILLLSLIDNVDHITSFIVDNTGQDDGATYSVTVQRDQVESMLGEDVRHYAEDEASLRQLIDRLNNLTFNTTQAVLQ